MDDQEVEQENSPESRQPGGEMDDNKYLQLSISAFITAIIIGLGWLFTELGQSKCMRLSCFDWIKVALLGISIIFGLLFLYKYKFNDSKTERLEWVNNFVESVCGAFPQIAAVTPLIVGVIIVTQITTEENANTSINKDTLDRIATKIDDTLPTITTQLSTINGIAVKIDKTLPAIAAQLSTNKDTLDRIATDINSITTDISNISSCPTRECPLSSPTPEITGCVVTYGLNVRKSAGVTASNHAKIWLRDNACMTILDTSTPEWGLVRIEGWVRLKKGETEYVAITVTPTATPTPTPAP